MLSVYIVRCNFDAPDKEAAWNDWYSGPKIADMLAKPHFLSCQRFRLALGSGRKYLALWTLRSPQAFETPEYKSDWGFFEWQGHVIDWSRDLFDGGARVSLNFFVAPNGALEVIAFDGMSADDAGAERTRIGARNVMWLPAIGLDRHTPLIGVRPLAAGAAPGEGGPRAVYRPICKFQTAAA